MRVLILGLGSMGKRRIRNLKQLGVHQITGYDTRTDRNQYARDRYGIEILDEFRWDVLSTFDVALICTPPDLHMEGAIECAKRGKHFFTEPDIDDHFHFVIGFESGVTGSVLVDVLQRKPNRYFRVVTENGTLIWDDWDQQRLKLIYEQGPDGYPHVLGHKPEYVEEELDLSGRETDWTGSEFETNSH